MAENDEKTYYVSPDGLAYYDSLVKNRDAQKSEIPKKLTDLNNDGNFVQDASYVHTESNFTAAEKTKLAGIDEGADVNVIDAITVNGTAVKPSGKTVNISVPTDNASLANGAGYQTAAQVDSAIAAKGYKTEAEIESIVEGYGYQDADQVETAIAAKGYQTAAQVESAVTGKGYQTKTQVDSAIAAAVADITSFSYSVVKSLPATGEVGVIYLIANSGTGQNVYDEYIWIGDKFEELGSTELDLSGYVKTSDLVPMTNAEIDALFAKSN